MKNISLGIDIGTSKVCIGEFEMNSQKWGLLTCEGKEVFPATYKIPNTPVIVESPKRCVFCEQSIQPSTRQIKRPECENPKNFHNKRWCKEGKLDFTIAEIEWKPSYLFIRHLENVLEKARKRLEEKYGDYRILEIKAGIPLIFHRGEWFVSWLNTQMGQVANITLGDKFKKETTVSVIEEPIASLMSYSYGRPNVIPQGFLLVIDVGAGTTDVALCERKGYKLTILNSDSRNIGGDNYDIAIKEKFLDGLIERIGDAFPVKDIWGLIRKFKEDYCNKQISPSLLLPRLEPIILKKDRIRRLFEPINNEIFDWIRDFANNPSVPRVKGNIKKIYLTGGGINVPSLKNKIQQLASNSKDMVGLEINEPDITRLDHKIASVAAGAAIPQDRYIKIIKFMLPGSLGLEKKEAKRNKFTELGLLYKYGTSHPSGSKTIKNIHKDSTLIIRFITRRRDRKEIQRISARRYYKEKKFRKPFNLTFEYTVGYNGKLTIKVHSTHRPEKEVIYDDFILI